MPRLKCTYADFLAIIEAHGFELYRHKGGSHRRYRAVINGRVYMVDLTPHNWNDEIKPGTLQSMIRQTGLKKKLFRK